MHLHFCLSTTPKRYHDMLADWIDVFGAVALDAGIKFSHSDSDMLLGGPINLVYQHFENGAADWLRNTKLSHGDDLRLGMLETEDHSDPIVMSGAQEWRAKAMRTVAEVADFIWYVIPATLPYLDYLEPQKVIRFNIGYSPNLRTTKLQTERDIDFLLPGLVYPRRRPIVMMLEKQGYRVVSTDLTTPASEYNALFGRTKFVIDVRRDWTSNNLSPMRICKAVNNGVAVLAESGDETDFRKYYAFTESALYQNFVETALQLVREKDAVRLGVEKLELFSTDTSMVESVRSLARAKVPGTETLQT